MEKNGLVNANAEAVQDGQFKDSDFFDPEDLVQVRYEMLRSVQMGERTAVAAAAVFGVSRATFYQAQYSFDQEGISGLIPKKRGPRDAHKLTKEIMDFIEEQLKNDPGLRSVELAEMISKQFQFSVHPRSVERALARKKKKKLRYQR